MALCRQNTSFKYTNFDSNKKFNFNNGIDFKVKSNWDNDGKIRALTGSSALMHDKYDNFTIYNCHGFDSGQLIFSAKENTLYKIPYSIILTKTNRDSDPKEDSFDCKMEAFGSLDRQRQINFDFKKIQEQFIKAHSYNEYNK